MAPLRGMEITYAVEAVSDCNRRSRTILERPLAVDTQSFSGWTDRGWGRVLGDAVSAWGVQLFAAVGWFAHALAALKQAELACLAVELPKLAMIYRRLRA